VSNVSNMSNMSTISTQSRTAQKILRRVKGLSDALHIDEEPLLAIPAIWDSGKEDHSAPCEVIVTNQRLIGYYCVTFPRKRVFLEDIQFAGISGVTLRHKTFEPLFRELCVREGSRKLYIRASRRHSEDLYAALRSACEQDVPAARATFMHEQTQQEQPTALNAPVFGRQEVRTTFERSPLAMTLLFMGGSALEVTGFVVWEATQSLQAGLPLFIAGLVAVLTAVLVWRQRA